jgi:hypothetical protein
MSYNISSFKIKEIYNFKIKDVYKFLYEVESKKPEFFEIEIAVVPLVWIDIAPVVSVIKFNAVAVVVPALIMLAILCS